MSNSDIADRLKQARLESGYRSARSFAKKFNIPLSTYAQHESGCRAISVDCLVNYCQLLGINPIGVLENKGSPNNESFNLQRLQYNDTIKKLKKEKMANVTNDYVDIHLLSKIFIAAAKMLSNKKFSAEAILYCYSIYDEIIMLSSDDKNVDKFINLAIDSITNSLTKTETTTETANLC